MVWRNAEGKCGLWFMPEDTPINGAVYINILQEKLFGLHVINRFARFQDTACYPTLPACYHESACPRPKRIGNG